MCQGDFSTRFIPAVSAQIADFGLKYRILKGNTKNRISGRTLPFSRDNPPYVQNSSPPPTSQWWELCSRIEDYELKVSITMELRREASGLSRKIAKVFRVPYTDWLARLSLIL